MSIKKFQFNYKKDIIETNDGGGSNCQFEPDDINSNFNVIHQPSQQYGSKCQIEPGRRAPEFEPLMENERVESKNEKTKTSNGETETKNKKTPNNRTKNKENPKPAKRFFNHIEFIDYIPTHEVITYRHLFAYGFYVE